MRKPRRTPHHHGSNGTRTGSFCTWDGETLILNVLGKPSAKSDAIGQVSGNQLNISVTEAPVAGRATDHMVRFLSAQFGVSTDDIEVVFGRFNVNKQLRIRSPRHLPPVISEYLSREASSAGRSDEVNPLTDEA
ncbi:MAG TPA: DUF167 family protein [Noviherbaspirillum sp.]|nr:DUF167 family protein [Noviherbaspirillum sp.]